MRDVAVLPITVIYGFFKGDWTFRQRSITKSRGLFAAGFV